MLNLIKLIEKNSKDYSEYVCVEDLSDNKIGFENYSLMIKPKDIEEFVSLYATDSRDIEKKVNDLKKGKNTVYIPIYFEDMYDDLDDMNTFLDVCSAMSGKTDDEVLNILLKEANNENEDLDIIHSKDVLPDKTEDNVSYINTKDSNINISFDDSEEKVETRLVEKEELELNKNIEELESKLENIVKEFSTVKLQLLEDNLNLKTIVENLVEDNKKVIEQSEEDKSNILSELENLVKSNSDLEKELSDLKESKNEELNTLKMENELLKELKEELDSQIENMKSNGNMFDDTKETITYRLETDNELIIEHIDKLNKIEVLKSSPKGKQVFDLLVEDLLERKREELDDEDLEIEELLKLSENLSDEDNMDKDTLFAYIDYFVSKGVIDDFSATTQKLSYDKEPELITRHVTLLIKRLAGGN